MATEHGRACALLGRLQDHHSASARHARRVADLSGALARQLRLAPIDVEQVRLGGLLHDLGKLEVPTTVLEGTGDLDLEGRAAIRRHPLAGIERLASLGPWPATVVDVVLYHHERWDGSGYPFGLVGQSTPLTARICAVADVFDALTSQRSYSQAWSAEGALRYIREHAGDLFDPRVASALARVTPAQAAA
jgi:putative nucleotidyltransferase with HDIG domain